MGGALDASAYTDCLHRRPPTPDDAAEHHRNGSYVAVPPGVKPGWLTLGPLRSQRRVGVRPHAMFMSWMCSTAVARVSDHNRRSTFFRPSTRPTRGQCLGGTTTGQVFKKPGMPVHVGMPGQVDPPAKRDFVFWVPPGPVLP